MDNAVGKTHYIFSRGFYRVKTGFGIVSASMSADSHSGLGLIDVVFAFLMGLPTIKEIWRELLTEN